MRYIYLPYLIFTGGLGLAALGGFLYAVGGHDCPASSKQSNSSNGSRFSCGERYVIVLLQRWIHNFLDFNWQLWEFLLPTLCNLELPSIVHITQRGSNSKLLVCNTNINITIMMRHLNGNMQCTNTTKLTTFMFLSLEVRF